MNGFYFIFKVYGIRDLQAIDLQRNCNVKMRSRQKEMRCFLSKKRNSTQ